MSTYLKVEDKMRRLLQIFTIPGLVTQILLPPTKLGIISVSSWQYWILITGRIIIVGQTSFTMVSHNIDNVKSVAIIGAGISGISAAAHLLLAGLDVTVLERSGAVGGVWHYDARSPLTPPFPNVAPPNTTSQYNQTPDGLTADETSIYHASPGPCYAGLRNNFELDVMRSTLLEWPQGTEGSIPALGVKNYIESLAETYHLLEHVRLWTRVENISRPLVSVYISSLVGGHYQSLKQTIPKLEPEMLQRFVVVAQVTDTNLNPCIKSDSFTSMQLKRKW